MKKILLLVFITLICAPAFSQTTTGEKSKDKAFSYAYVAVSGKLFSQKLRVVVDLGDTPEQVQLGDEYSEILTNRKSFASILNYMIEKDYELVQTLTVESNSGGTGGTTGVIFIMKKVK